MVASSLQKGCKMFARKWGDGRGELLPEVKKFWGCRFLTLANDK
jgi:hypothetical protein